MQGRCLRPLSSSSTRLSPCHLQISGSVEYGSCLDPSLPLLALYPQKDVDPLWVCTTPRVTNWTQLTRPLRLLGDWPETRSAQLWLARPGGTVPPHLGAAAGSLAPAPPPGSSVAGAPTGQLFLDLGAPGSPQEADGLADSVLPPGLQLVGGAPKHQVTQGARRGLLDVLVGAAEEVHQLADASQLIHLWGQGCTPPGQGGEAGLLTLPKALFLRPKSLLSVQRHPHQPEQISSAR